MKFLGVDIPGLQPGKLADDAAEEVRDGRVDIQNHAEVDVWEDKMLEIMLRYD
jgi:hypothetical protein